MSQTLRRRADPKRKMDWFCVFCYGDEENARIYVVHLTTANQSTMRRAHRVFVLCTGINSKETGRCENYITML